MEDELRRQDAVTADEIVNAVKECILLNCYEDTSWSDIKRETEFKKDLGFDSLDIVELVLEVEDTMSAIFPHLRVRVPEGTGDEIRTVGNLIDVVLASVKNAGVHVL